MHQQHQPFHTRNFFYILLLAVIYLAYLLIKPYLGVILFSLVAVVVFRPAYESCLRLTRGHQEMALVVAFLLMFLAVLLPVLWLVQTLVQQLSMIVNASAMAGMTRSALLLNLLDAINALLAPLPFLPKYQITEAALLAALTRYFEPIRLYLTGLLITVGYSSIDWLTGTIIFLSIVGATLPAYPKLVQWIKELSPLDDELDAKILDRVTIMTVSMFKGIIVVAVAQGLVTGLLFRITDTPFVLLLTILAIGCGVIPLGASIVAVPVAFYQLLAGNFWQAVVILLGYFVIVANLDNVIRPMLVSKETPLSSALVVLSGFGGLNWFGLPGVIYGPVIMIILMTLLEIYKEHFAIVQVASNASTPELWRTTDSAPDGPTA